MSMLAQYTKRILASKTAADLSLVIDQIRQDPNLTGPELNQLESLILSKKEDLGVTSSSSFTQYGEFDLSASANSTPSNFIQYGEYNVDDVEDLEPCTNLWKDSTYLRFLEDEFFDRFVHIPYPEYQKKLLITLLFINSKACGNKIPLSHFYFYSKQPNSGKSTFAKYIANHYTEGSYVYIAEDTPGGTLRQIFSDANQYNNPTYCLLDNFHPQKTVERLGAFYGRLLKYTKEESQCSVSQGIGKELLEFNTFGLKVFTSIFPLDRKTDELRTRCFTCLFEAAPSTLDDLDLYNWSPLQQEYYRIWGDTAKASETVRSLMNKLNRYKSQAIKNRKWQLTKYLIVVGLMIGIHKDIDDAVSYYTRYFDWIESIELGEGKNSLQLALEEYLKVTHPKRVEKENALFGDEAFLKLDEIYYNDLFTHLSKVAPISKNMSTENQITNLLGQQGWEMKLIRNVRGDRIDIVYRLLESSSSMSSSHQKKEPHESPTEPDPVMDPPSSKDSQSDLLPSFPLKATNNPYQVGQQVQVMVSGMIGEVLGINGPYCHLRAWDDPNGCTKRYHYSELEPIG